MAQIYGTAHRKDGSKIDGTVTVSTSWNGNKAFPKNGQYSLNLGNNPKKSITVYVNGMRYTNVYVDGSACVNIVVR